MSNKANTKKLTCFDECCCSDPCHFFGLWGSADKFKQRDPAIKAVGACDDHVDGLVVAAIAMCDRQFGPPMCLYDREEVKNEWVIKNPNPFWPPATK
ncbi:MAG: hypothetical protein UY09_C0028G0003 [Parcubacteria group bacterium GW2011_GWA2_47_8]|nr:MAG: hypothetical protein UY09_C0028G0003 [Parcubacteria group bacterium GW2011_GWA2_47_8]OHB20549.1 MAG: hypothetical protein A2666_03750 [Parcubacteria group bacterium RIFCSPHIGHO2_01_FULL_47_10b]